MTVLPVPDAAFLMERRLEYSVALEGGMLCIVLPQWALPSGYTLKETDLLVRLPGGYPDLPPDMWWFDPAVLRVDGRDIPATQAVEHHLGRNWQRWSRHLGPEQWRSGVDGIGSFLALIREELIRCATTGVS